jgi:exodeoxyribonuclease VII small subunit
MTKNRTLSLQTKTDSTHLAMKKKIEEQPFEQALENLETIVAAMEKGDIPLSDLVAKYEEASKLLVRCRKCLDDARMTVDRLKGSGEVVETEPFEPGEAQG